MKTLSNFRIVSEKNEELFVNLSVHGFPFEGSSYENRKKVLYDSKVRGLRWSNDEREITVFHENYTIKGYPSPDLKFVIAVFLKDDFLENATIYKADGSEHLKLRVPKLISELAARLAGKKTIEFADAKWAVDSEGHIVTAVEIRFNNDWYELRALDPLTGQFGELLKSGRY